MDTRSLSRAATHEIESGLEACQVAVAKDNEVIFNASFGTATSDTRF